MKAYNLSKQQIEEVKYKIKRNKYFLMNNGVKINNQILPFAAFITNTYVNQYQYLAEIQHRVWSLHNYAMQRELVPLFVTLTLPSEWHSHKQLTLKNGKTVFVKNKHYEGMTPKEGSKELSRLLHQKIYNHRTFRAIKKENRVYFRVTEPHKDGTPHLHIMYYIPKEKKDDFIKMFKSQFKEPQLKIESAIQKPVNYLMKYILKTVDDLRTDENNLTPLTYWYIYHGIARFYTSRTLISLDVYRALNGFYTNRG